MTSWKGRVGVCVLAIVILGLVIGEVCLYTAHSRVRRLGRSTPVLASELEAERIDLL